MEKDQPILEEFETGLNPQSPEKSKVPATVKGYGEISSIFSIDGIPGKIFKRLPLFNKEADANKYVNNYNSYTNALNKAGLTLPNDSTNIIMGEQVVLYVGQKELHKNEFCHRLLHTLTEGDSLKMIEKIFSEILKVWHFNLANKPELELSIDGQVSNWAAINNQIVYVDTSTPLFKINGEEQLDPELLLNSTPGVLKWIIRKFFLEEVMNRYYDLRLVYIDLVANLYKEQKEALIDQSLEIANQLLSDDFKAISRKEIDVYYKDDKFTWQLFLFFRKIDRWFTNKILRKKYQFILPGKIKR